MLAARRRAPGVVAHDGLQLPLRAGRARRAREIVASGELGEIVHFRARYLQSWGWEAPHSWRFDAARVRHRRDRRPRRALDRPRPLPRRRDRLRVARSSGRSSRAARSTTPTSPRSSSSRARSARSRPPASRPAASTTTPGRSTAPRGSLAFDQERMNELLVGDGARLPSACSSTATGGRRATSSAGATRSRYEYLHLLGAIAGEHELAPGGRDLRGRLPRRRGLRRDPALGRRAGGGRDTAKGVTMKTSLGIWAFGPMSTRFVPGGYQPQWAGEPTADKVRRAVEGLGDLIDGYEFHYPQELSPDNLDAVRAALGGHDIYCIASGMHLDPLFGKGGLCSPDDKVRDEAIRRTLEAVDFTAELGRALHHLAGDRGLQLPVPDAVRGVVGALHRRDRAGRAAGDGARRDDLPRAQELRAGDEDLHAQHRHDAARDPHAAPPGPRQRQGQHGLAAPDHERREPRRVRGAARGRGPARAPARELGLGDVRRRQHGRRDGVHGDARARARAAPRRLRRRAASGSASTSIPYTEDAVAAVERSVLQWRFIDSSPGGSTRRRCARRSRRRTPCAPTSSCTRRSATQ